MKCPKCGSKMADASCMSSYWEWSEDPYEIGIMEKVVDRNNKEIENPDIWLNLCCTICPNCDWAEWISIEESNYKIKNVYNHTCKPLNWYSHNRNKNPDKINIESLYEGNREEERG